MATSRTSQMLCKANTTGLLPLLIPFLHRPAPAPSIGPATSHASFSTSSALCARRKPDDRRNGGHDNNRMRGLSAIRSTGLRRRQTLSILKEPLPKPVYRPKKERYTETVTDEKHGLWKFFGRERRCMTTPEEENAHGREWTTSELRAKSFEDLHRLWWVCSLERNRIATNQRERERLRAGYGKFEAGERDKKVRETMRNIRWTLIERWYAYQDARRLAERDREVDLSGQWPAFRPAGMSYAEETHEEAGQAVEGDVVEKQPIAGLPETKSTEQRVTV